MNQKEQVLSLSEQGFSTRKIAEQLGISKSQAHRIVQQGQKRGNIDNAEGANSEMPQFSPQTSPISPQKLPQMPQKDIDLSQILSKNSSQKLSKLSETAQIVAKEWIKDGIDRIIADKGADYYDNMTSQEMEELIDSSIEHAHIHCEAYRLGESFYEIIEHLSYTPTFTKDSLKNSLNKMKRILNGFDSLLRMLYSNYNEIIKVKEHRERTLSTYVEYHKIAEMIYPIMSKSTMTTEIRLSTELKVYLKEVMDIPIRKLIWTYSSDECADIVRMKNLQY